MGWLVTAVPEDVTVTSLWHHTKNWNITSFITLHHLWWFHHFFDHFQNFVEIFSKVFENRGKSQKYIVTTRLNYFRKVFRCLYWSFPSEQLKLKKADFIRNWAHFLLVIVQNSQNAFQKPSKRLLKCLNNPKSGYSEKIHHQIIF